MAETKDELPQPPAPHYQTDQGFHKSYSRVQLFAYGDARAEHAERQAARKLAELQREVEGLRKDAERYRWLREQHWDKNTMCVVTRPKSCVKLGSICPSGELLDFDIDASLSSGRSGSGEVSNG